MRAFDNPTVRSEEDVKARPDVVVTHTAANFGVYTPMGGYSRLQKENA